MGICGTFDVENYGDLLFPIIAHAELEKRLGPLRLHPFSYHEKSATSWPYAVHSLTELQAIVPDLDAILVGGGDLIRFDKDIAPGYGPPESNIHHPTGYWLAPMLIGLQARCPVLWNAPGVHGPVPSWAEPLMKLAVESSDYLSVRDEASRRALDPFRGEAGIEVVPDTAFGVGQLLRLDEPSAEYIRIRESAGLKDGYLLIQAAGGLGSFWRLIEDHRRALGDVQVVIVAVGPVLGDDVTVLGRLPGVTVLEPWPRPLALAELIGHAAGVVGTSLHLAISALAFGVPVFRPSQAVAGKYRVLEGLDGVETFDNEAAVDPEWLVSRLGRTQPSPAVLDACNRLSRHWDHIASIVATSEPRNAGPASLPRFWLSAANLLESSDAHVGSALAERDAVAAERDAAAGERDAAAGERDVVSAQLAAIHRSHSWRITAPLRAIRDRLRRSAKTKEKGT